MGCFYFCERLKIAPIETLINVRLSIGKVDIRMSINYQPPLN